MYQYLATLRPSGVRLSTSTSSKPQRRKGNASSPAPLENFSAQRATWLFVCQPEELDERQQAELASIRQASPRAETAYHLAHAFMQMIREQTGEQFDTWRRRSRSKPLARIGIICQRHSPRQSSSAGRIDAALEHWSSRGAGEPAAASLRGACMVAPSSHGSRARVLHVVEKKKPSRAALLAREECA
jgi:hypothetical protein